MAADHSPTEDASADPTFDPETGITNSNRGAVAGLLGHVLADSYQLFIETQGVHWNVTGPLFYSVHKLTEEHYTNLFEAVDALAERIRALGHKTPASYSKYGELSEIRDEDEPRDAHAMLHMLCEDHEAVCRSLRKAIAKCDDKKDFVTGDMLIARLAWHEEAIWMLTALSQGGKASDPLKAYETAVGKRP